MVNGFITFEGIDGCGKSTVAKIIFQQLKKDGVDVELTQEPTETWLGDAVRRSYTEDIHPFTEAFLFLADRATHTKWIEERLYHGVLVISDRYSDSTVAYQAALFKQSFGGDPAHYIKYLQDISRPIIRVPNITFLFDIDPDISLKRVGNRGEKEKFETLENLRQVRQNYLDIAAESPHFRIINAAQTIEEVADAVWKIIMAEL